MGIEKLLPKSKLGKFLLVAAVGLTSYFTTSYILDKALGKNYTPIHEEYLRSKK